MASCTLCFGSGRLSTGRYENCYSCGGSGHGSSTDQACIACRGSGKSSTEIKDICWRCNGQGVIVDDSPSYNSNTSATTNPNNEYSQGGTKGNPTKKDSSTQRQQQKTTNGISGSVTGLSLLVSGLIGFSVYEKSHNFGEAASSGFITYLVCFAALYVAYYLFKVIFEIFKVIFNIAIWLLLLLFLGNLLNIELAIKIKSFLIYFLQKVFT